jgi:hypothetical protein
MKKNGKNEVGSATIMSPLLLTNVLLSNSFISEYKDTCLRD